MAGQARGAAVVPTFHARAIWNKVIGWCCSSSCSLMPEYAVSFIDAVNETFNASKSFGTDPLDDDDPFILAAVKVCESRYCSRKAKIHGTAQKQIAAGDTNECTLDDLPAPPLHGWNTTNSLFIGSNVIPQLLLNRGIGSLNIDIRILPQLHAATSAALCDIDDFNDD